MQSWRSRSSPCEPTQMNIGQRQQGLPLPTSCKGSPDSLSPVFRRWGKETLTVRGASYGVNVPCHLLYSIPIDEWVPDLRLTLIFFLPVRVGRDTIVASCHRRSNDRLLGSFAKNSASGEPVSGKLLTDVCTRHHPLTERWQTNWGCG